MTNYLLKENDKILQIIYSPDDDIVNNIKKSLKENQTFEETDMNFIPQDENINNLETELLELEKWFTEYDLQVKQYERATRLGETFDKSIEMLDNEAREKALRIKELRKLLEG
jgi:DNA integrity scanning protein DisA with diadenylate cyclase activity